MSVNYVRRRLSEEESELALLDLRRSFFVSLCNAPSFDRFLFHGSVERDERLGLGTDFFVNWRYGWDDGIMRPFSGVKFNWIVPGYCWPALGSTSTKLEVIISLLRSVSSRTISHIRSYSIIIFIYKRFCDMKQHTIKNQRHHMYFKLFISIFHKRCSLCCNCSTGEALI